MNLSQFNRILIQTLLLPVLALAGVATVLVWQVRSAQKTVATIQAADQGMTTTGLVYRRTIDEETGLRGYQITSDTQFLQPYYQSAPDIAAALNTLRGIFQSQGESIQPVLDLEAHEQAWRFSFAQPLIAEVAGGADTRSVAQNMRGKVAMDSVRADINNIFARETAVRQKEVARWRRQTRVTIIALIVLALGAGVVISLFTVSRLHRVSDAYQGTLNGLRLHAQATFESEERLRTTLTSIGDGVIVCDPEGRVELLNNVAQELTGWSQTEAFRRPLEDVFHIVNEASRELVETPVAKVKRLQRVVGLANHTILIRRNGTEINIDDSGAPIYKRSGALSGIVMVFRDITHERRAQDALLATEKLAVAGRLAATIAHEIHNPLDSVVNLLYLMRDETDTVTSHHYLDLAQQELGRMGQISRAMLGLYREAKSAITIDIKEMLESVLVLLDRQLKNKTIHVENQIADGLRVEGYPAELRQVFTNLVANAVDACSANGSITISATRSSARDGSSRPGVVIQVADTGSGIEPAALERIFQPFFTTKGEGGTGLGLWVSKGIIEKHGGTIDIRSSIIPQDQGTTITVFLPRTGPAATRPELPTVEA